MLAKVCVVVVTYNRLSLLQRLIALLETQTYPVSNIVIVDNGSTDGTKEWLNTLSYTVVHQQNVGSAGGFYSGIKKATQQDTFDYIWIMDDDGYPSAYCLEKLLTSKARESYGNNVVLCSTVVNQENAQELSFPLPDLNSKYYKLLDYNVRQTDKVSDITLFNDPNGYPWGLFFNSVLLPISAITTAGLPKKELFIWGDEVEYFYRIKKNGFKIYMVPDSIFYHPKLNPAKPAIWKEKYRVRNYVYIHKAYKPLPLVHFANTFAKILIQRKFYLLRPFYHGLTSNFKHKYHIS